MGSKKGKIQFWRDSGKADPGPNELQKRYFINRMSPEKRPHWHTQDALISVGGQGSGKTYGMDVCIADILCSYKGAKGLIGGIDLQLLKRNTTPVFRQFFTIDEEWDHEAVVNRLSDQQNNLRFSNSSELTLVNLTQFLKTVGVNMGVIGVEEPHLLDSVNAFHMLLGRLRETIPEVKQLIMCTNPERSRDGWMNQAFDMHRFKGVDTSEHPVEISVGKPCRCQWCTKCRISLGKKVSWEKDGDNFVCPNCKARKDFWTWEGKRFFCPGDQQYTRVIKSESMHNPHLPDDYFQRMEDDYDPLMFRILVKGETDLDVREDFVYKEFSKAPDPENPNDSKTWEQSNVLEEAIDLDFDKDILWGLDFNLRPQCSVIAQIEEKDGMPFLAVKQELVMYGPTLDDPYGGASPEDVVAQFIKLIKPQYKGTTIKIYGDPHAYGGQTDRELSKYHIIYNALTKEDVGFNVEVIADQTIISLKERVDCVNTALRDKALRINPPIEGEATTPRHTLASLESLKWHEKIKDKLDQKGDNNARRSTNRSIIYCMTHPTDALSYIIFKEFNIIKDFGPPQGMVVSGKVTVEKVGEKISTTYHNAPETTKSSSEPLSTSYIDSYNELVKTWEATLKAELERQQNISMNGLLGGDIRKI